MTFFSRMRLRLFACLALALTVCGPAAALDPRIALQDYNHMMWTAREGAPGEIKSMAQTPDGWLWLGTGDGLYRFDGVRFERYTLPGPPALSRNRIFDLHALPNGDLLITYAVGGLSLLRKDGHLEDLVDPASSPMGPIGATAVDTDGSLWAAANNGIYHYSGRRWRQVEAGPDWLLNEGRSMLLDQYGRLWAAHQKGVFLYQRASGKFERWPGSGAGGSLLLSPDGRLWAVNLDGARVVEATPPGAALPRPAGFNQSEARMGGQFDRDGNLWALKCPQVVCLVTEAERGSRSVLVPSQLAGARLDRPGQLAALAVNAMLEDQEGNIWIASQAGLDRFRENKLIPAHIPGNAGVFSMGRDDEGRVWAAEPGGKLWLLSATAAPQAATGYYTAISNDRDGALLLAGRRSIERRYRGGVTQIALPPRRDGTVGDLTVMGVLDDGKVLWIAAIETGLMGLRDGRWLPRSAFNLPPRIFQSAAGGKGQLWLGMDDGALVLYDDGKLSTYDAAAAGLASGIFPGAEPLVSGDKGLGVLQGGRFRLLKAADPEVLRNISGLVVTADGDRWFNGSRGIVHVRQRDWRASMDAPQLPLRYELLNVLEGYPGRASLDNRLSSVLDGGDGQLWFRATGGVVRLDTRARNANPVRPVVDILRVNTAHGSYPARPGLRLPAGSQAFNIEFTAPGLRLPEGMRFQFRLETVDAGWQTAGSQRTAFYTNLAPGRYRFAVRALNEDGVVSANEALLQLEILPSVIQTAWFKLACALLLLLLFYGLYRYRVQRVTAGLARTLTVRMEERERIARTLHDTILQSVQTIILRLHSLNHELPPSNPTRQKLEALLESADDTVSEGRDQVHQLRQQSETELPEMLAEAGAALEQNYPQTAFTLRVEGQRRPLREPVRQEVAEIAREALRNAFQHGAASAVELVLAYQPRQLKLQVADNGKGFAPSVQSTGQREGHWGLVGMRERAAGIGGSLDIHSSATGVTLSLALTARRAYAVAPRPTLRGLLARSTAE